MAEKIYKKDDPIIIDFQATVGSTSATITIYKPDGTVNEVQGGAMIQVGQSGVWRKSFIPNEVGGWMAIATDNKGGKATKSYSVGGTNIDEIGSAVGTVDEKVGSIKTDTDEIKSLVSSPPMMG
jgi:hypothetical protein